MSSGPGGSGAAPGPRVFICYRREESAAYAGRLYDAMVARFGEDNVFMDVDLAPGVDFVERITEVVAACQVLIVVMGPRWATVTDEGGGVRIADPEDFVRLEVGTGLKRVEVTPIPVLVAGARMPRPEDLPPEVRPITRRNALELSDARWRYDVDRLNTRLDQLLPDITPAGGLVVPPPQQPPPAPPPPQQPMPRAEPQLGARTVLEGMLVAGLAAFAARYLADLVVPNLKHIAGAIAAVVLRRGVTWALTGAAIAVWLGARTERTDLLRLGLWGLLVGAIAGAVGGAIWALPVYRRYTNPSEVDLASAFANRIEIASVAVTGGLLGGLIGGLWRPPRIGVGLLSGACAAAVVQLIFNQSEKWNEVGDFPTFLGFAILAAAIAGLSLAALFTLDPRRARARPVDG